MSELDRRQTTVLDFKRTITKHSAQQIGRTSQLDQGGRKMYDTQRQKTPSVADEITANIAEYAAMSGLVFAQAYSIASKNYWHIIARLNMKRIPKP